MSQDNVTAWLVAWGKGDPAADSRLIEAVYTDLRRVLGVVRFGNLCGAHVVGDAPADLNRTPRLECAIFPFPDIPAADEDPEVDLVELFNDVFDFVRNELDRILNPREVDINRHEHACQA